MSSSTSPSRLKFLFDENVDKRLEKALRRQGVDVVSKQKGLSDGKLAEFSRAEKRALVTNDEDFRKLGREKVFSVVWLRIPQREIELSVASFLRLLKEKTRAEDFEGFLIELKEDGSIKAARLPKTALRDK